MDGGWEVFAFEEGFFLRDHEEFFLTGLAGELLFLGGC
jgi:hypothetical protein